MEFSPSDLNRYVECAHLLQLEIAASRAERVKPHGRSEQAELVARKGDEHERRYLESLRSSGLAIVEIDTAWSFERAAVETVDAMRRGADVVYQATFVDDAWRGRADFLIRVASPSALGGYGYEVEDTKLARHPKPTFLLQLCFYSAQVARIQERNPALMHVVLGTSERRSFRYSEYSAYYRRVRARFLRAVDERPTTVPYPVAHCALCDWIDACEGQWQREDHLTLIPFLRRDHAAALMTAGVSTVAALSSQNGSIEGIGDAPLEAYRDHARLQRRARESGRHAYELLPVSGRGLGRLPEPCEGDVFFDMEGDPYFGVGRGLEYLFGLITADTGALRFNAIWSHDFEEERRAFESVIDFIVQRRKTWPALHVYHYAPYEPTAMIRLMGCHGTREDDLDDLLRHHVFVDLYAIVRQSLRISLPGYSIKQIRRFFMAAERTCE